MFLGMFDSGHCVRADRFDVSPVNNTVHTTRKIKASKFDNGLVRQRRTYLIIPAHFIFGPVTQRIGHHVPAGAFTDLQQGHLAFGIGRRVNEPVKG